MSALAFSSSDAYLLSQAKRDGVTTQSGTNFLPDRSDLAAEPRVRRIRIYPRMPDHQILEASDFRRSFHNLDLAIF